MATTRKDAIIAHHEGGHAVVARALGVSVPYVTVLSVSDDAAATATTERASWLARDLDLSARIAALEMDAKINLAGPHAQHRYCPVKNVKKALDREWVGDMAEAHSAVTRIVLLKEGAHPGDAPTAVTLTEQQLARCNDLLAQLWKESFALV